MCFEWKYKHFFSFVHRSHNRYHLPLKIDNDLLKVVSSSNSSSGGGGSSIIGQSIPLSDQIKMGKHWFENGIGIGRRGAKCKLIVMHAMHTEFVWTEALGFILHRHSRRSFLHQHLLLIQYVCIHVCLLICFLCGWKKKLIEFITLK